MRHHCHKLITSALLGLLLAAGPLPVAAADAPADRTVLAQGGPSLSDAIDRVRRQYGGRIVSAETQMRGNREVHVIKVLTDDGKVKTVRIPGRVRGSRG